MVLARFLPRNERFFDFFREAANNAVEVATLLYEALEHPEDAERKVRRLRDLEHRGDEISHQVFNALNRTFVTPLDREDIRALTSKLDDFVDDMEEVGRRIRLYKIARPTEPALLLARIIRDQAGVLAQAVPLLEHTKESEALMRQIVEINRLEDEADDALNQALGGLYDAATDIPSLIQALHWGEIYNLLEEATDRAEDVANTLEAIVIKNA